MTMTGRSPMTEAEWKPSVRTCYLSDDIMVAARTRIEGSWAAYIGTVSGHSHDYDRDVVLLKGNKLPADIARVVIPCFAEMPYSS